MSYINDSLSKGEEVEKLFNHHWTAWFAMYFMSLVVTVITLGVGVILAILWYLALKKTEMGVTNKRIILKTGIISRKTEEMKITSIETVEIDQGVIGRMLGYGDIKVTGRGISDVVFKNVDDPMEVKRQIESVSNPTD